MDQSLKTGTRLAAAATLLLALTACTGSGSPPAGHAGDAATDADSRSKAAASAAVDATGWNGEKYVEPITLTTVKGVGNNFFFKQGETMEDNVLSRYVKDRLGIDVRYNWIVTDTNNAYSTKLRLMLSSGEPVPDVVVWRGDADTLNALIDSGRFMDVTGLFDRYASDVYKQGTELIDDTFLPVTRGGKKWALPILDYAYNDDMVLWLRQDWMDKLHLEGPKTLADFEQVMDAFVHRDPDGNGVPDTLGVALGFKNAYLNWMTDVSWVFGAFGTIPGQWNKSADGTLAYGSIQPGAKQALAVLKSWMDKGYIAEDSALRDETSGIELFTSGRAGAVVSRNWLPDWPFNQLLESNPNARYKPYPIPKGPDGRAGTQGGNPGVNGWILINKEAKHPEAILRYYNFFFEHWANPQVGSEFENGFAEGYDWARLPNGEITHDPQKYPELFPGYADRSHLVEPIYYSLTYEGARIPSLYVNTMAKLAAGGKPETPYEKMTAAVRKPENIEAMNIILEQKEIRLQNYFRGPLTETMALKNELLNKLVNETYTKIIYGQADLDEFDRMVGNWRKFGGDQVTKEVNAWYRATFQ
ncbi:extracellular solute-binding protein [Paenibacillus athensensis]|uniref:ABC transporter substrate-binding protein n=1 Tax=Paenibacillus athensensis TaxID=1967502 RepID=A0A4Y8PR04_9BACL|nr:extracellular solute-binding protein [Paenibacillus athensensis]MCD1261172.1 extracellular solute-binding protein [Paenibacillus athensensis]